MQPVMAEISIFDMFHDPSKAALHARSQILLAVNESLAELMPDRSSKLAVKLLQHALLRNAGAVYASSWRKEAGDVIDFLMPMSETQRTQELAKHPGGAWSLKEIDEGFRIAFAKLTEMVSYLATPMQDPVAEVAAPNGAERAPLAATTSSTGSASASPADWRPTEQPSDSARYGVDEPLRDSDRAPRASRLSDDQIPSEIIEVPDWLNDAPEWDDEGPLTLDELEQMAPSGPGARSDGG